MNKPDFNFAKQSDFYNLKKIGFLLIVLLACNSCSVKKRIYRSGYYVSWYSWLDDKSKHESKQFLRYSLSAYDALSVKLTQETCINVADPAQIVCTEGTVIDIPENAFEYENGNDLKCTKVCVYVWEYYSLADIIAAGLTTTSNRKMLFSDGMVYIEARCFGERLKLKSGKEIKVQMPSQAPDDKMQIFAGNFKNGIIDWKVKGTPEINSTSDGTTSDIETESNDNERPYLDETNDSITGETISIVYGRENSGENNVDNGYIMNLSSLGWINCDRFYDIQEKTKLIVKVESMKNTFVALIFKEIKSMMPGYCFSNNTIEFANIPDGQEVTLLAYSIDEKTKSAKACTYDLLLGETKEIDIKMNEMALDELKSLLASFN